MGSKVDQLLVSVTSAFVVFLVSLLVPLPAHAQAGWEHLGPSGGSFLSLAIPGNGSERLSASYDGVWVASDDGGIGWRPLPAPPGFTGTSGYGGPVVQDPRPGGGLFGRFSPGNVSPPVEDVWRLADDGSSWVEIPCGLHELLFPPADADVVYCWSRAGGAVAGRRSNDGGLTWANDPLPVPEDAFAGAPPELQAADDNLRFSIDGGRSFALIPAPGSRLTAAAAIDAQRYLVTSYDGAFRSADGGQTWLPANQGLFDERLQGVAAEPGGTGRAWVWGRAGLFVTSNAGASWSPVATELGTPISDVWPDPADLDRLLAADLESEDGGATWSTIDDPDLYPYGRYEEHPLDPDLLVFRNATPSIEPSLSRDGGRSWEPLPHPPMPSDLGYPCRDVRIDPRTVGAFFCLDIDLFHTSDFGQEWRKVGSPSDVETLSPAFGVYASLLSVSADGGLLRVVRAVHSSEANRWDLLESADSGARWRVLTELSFQLSGIEVDPADGSSLLLFGERPLPIGGAFSAGTFARWDATAGALEEDLDLSFEGWVTTVAPAPGFPGVLLLGTSAGRLHRSVDFGRTWIGLAVPWGEAWVSGLRFRGTTIYAATGVGVYRSLDLITTDCVGDANTLCLLGERFRATAGWKTESIPLRAGGTLPITADSGAFWFFQPSNVEVLLKVLDGCAINAHYWVFAAGLTNLEVVLTVVDTATTAVWTRTSPAGPAFRAILDTAALDCAVP